MKTAVFLQVRLDSTRLPGKALKNLADRTVIEHAMLSLGRIKADNRVLLTTHKDAETLSPFAEKSGFELFAGPKDDVLKRFVLASEKFQPDWIIRATGDNPLVSSDIAEEAYELALSTNADYCAVTGSPIGTGVEVLKTTALVDAEKRTNDPYCREHVAPYLYQNPELYNIKREDTERNEYRSSQSVTLDTEEDYIFLQSLYEKIYDGSSIPLDKLVEFLKGNL